LDRLLRPARLGRIKGARRTRLGQPVIVVILEMMARAAGLASIAGSAFGKECGRGADIMRAIVVAMGAAVAKNRGARGLKNNELQRKQATYWMNRRF